MIRLFHRITVVVALAAAAVSCVETAQNEADTTERLTFSASCYADQTRTVLVDRVNVYWQPGDEIAVSGASDPFVTDIVADARVADFTGEADKAEVYNAVYPYEAVAEWADEIVLLTLPAQQPALKGSFAPGMNISVASTTDQDMSFYFRNVLGYAKFSVGSGMGRITSVTVSANGGEALAGDFYVDCSSDDPLAVPDAEISSVTLVSDSVLEDGDYYIAMIPGTYADGLTFTFTGPDGTAVKKVDNSLSLERGKIQTVNVSGLEWVADEAFYVKVNENLDNWAGDYLIVYDDVTSLGVFNSWTGSDKGASTVDLYPKLTSDGIPAEDGDPYKTVISKVGSSYSVFVTGVGYIGLTSSSNSLAKQEAAPSSADTKYLWNLSYYDGELWMTNASYTNRRLQWNASAGIFRCYTGSQQEITLFRRSASSGDVVPDPDPDPTPDPDPEPDPDPTPDPAPGSSGKYAWYELPVMNLKSSGNYLVDASDSDLYYAYHLCAGNEKGPGGKKARNYTVCYSAEHHCPVWVAAPRHSMYEGSANRTNAYGKDPDIPSSIQYNSKNTGGGCNKGHMLGSAERTSSTATNKQVFYYTNIAPQYSGTFNTGGGGWNTLEDWVDGQVCSDTLYVVIGAYFETFTDGNGYTGSPKTISFGGRDDVTRPSMYYYLLMRTKKGNTGKALSECSASEIKCAAFVRSHETPKGTKVSADEMMSVSELEKITGFTYFPNVPNAPKNSYSASDWGL